MGTAYYYFSASLPMIEFEGLPPVSSDSFLADCQRLLAAEDFLMIESLFSDDVLCLSGNSVYRSWCAFEHNLRNELAFVRAQNLGKDPSDYVRGERVSDSSVLDAIHQAQRQSDLMAAEKLLDKARWQYLDDLALGQHYNIEFLIVYALKIKILERYQSFKSAKGSEVFEGLKKVDIAV